MKWRLQGSSNWTNLLKWPRSFYHKECNGMSLRGRNATNDDVAVGQLFGLVQESQRGSKQISWVLLEGVLERTHQVMAALKKQWA